MAQTISLKQSAAQTATGQGDAKAVAGIKELVVFFDLTAISGAGADITPYLQSSRDGGATWFDIAHDGSKKLDAAEAEPAGIAAGNRNIQLNITAVEKWSARYTNFGDQVRIAWVITGTTPSVTFQVDAVGK